MNWFHSLFGPRYTVARAEFTPEDEANIRDFVNMPHYQSFQRWIGNRVADMNEEILTSESENFRQRIGELTSMLRGLDNFKTPRPKADDPY